MVALFDSFKSQKRIEYDVSYANIFHGTGTHTHTYTHTLTQ